MHSRRALLYVPGDDAAKIKKALTFGVDSICMDMEDGVAVSRKAEARIEIANALGNLDFGNSEKLARINASGTGYELEDIRAVLPHRPDGIVIPKVEGKNQLDWADELIKSAELEQGLPLLSIRLLVGIETPKGMLNLQEIAAHPRLDALIFGGEDFAAAIGATRTTEAVELMVARQQVIMAAAAFNLQPIDMVSIDFTHPKDLRKEALAGARLGFAGKQIIHPAQVEPVQAAFTPDEASIIRARDIVDRFAAFQMNGKGVFVLDGKMIDKPLVRNAERVLERARAAGLI